MLLRVVPEARGSRYRSNGRFPITMRSFISAFTTSPAPHAESMMKELAEYTQQPNPARLTELLQALDENPDILIILNHPMWDMAGIGHERHERLLRTLLCDEGECIPRHGIERYTELGGESAGASYAEAFNQLLISGGDRHGCEPNATLNLTSAESFTEFVHEIRKDRRSHVLFMPQYQEPMVLRTIQTLLEVIRDYPD